MKINLGPFSFRHYAGDNWSHLELAFVTNRNGGMARRETAVKAGFKSDHITDMAGKNNPADKFVNPDTGSIYFGKIVKVPGGFATISAAEVYTRALYERACQDGLHAAERATNGDSAVNTPEQPVTAG